LSKPKPILLVRMNNKLKEFEELLLDNTLLKVKNQVLGDRNPKRKEWWQTVKEFMEEQIQDNMELVRSKEQSYQLELHTYRIVFPNFKYKPLSFVSIEIIINSKVPPMPFRVQLIANTKPFSPLKGGTCLNIIPLPIQTFIIPIIVVFVVNEHVKGSERSDKEQVEPINPSFTIMDNIIECLELLSANLPLTPHQIGRSQYITLISSTPHASEVFTTPIATFEDTLD